MKKLLFILTTVCFTCFSTSGFTQVGDAAKSSEQQGSSGFAWGIGLGALAAIATMVGLVVSSSTDSPSTTQGQAH